MPIVSVIMPAYNAARYIGEAIHSVLSQTWQDWELIVVDDGSNDGSRHILQGFHDSRIRVLQQDHRGEAAARNTAMNQVRGDFLVFLDADDLLLPNSMTDHVSYLESHPEVDVVFSDGYFCDADGQLTIRLSEHRPGIYTGNILEPLVLTASVISGTLCTMTRRETIEQFALRFDEALTIGPDWDFWIRLAEHAQFGYLDKLTCKYRVHRTNVTLTTSLEKRRESLILGRLKVLRAPFFEKLSASTKSAFFYQLLIDLLGNQPSYQAEIMASINFRALPASEKAKLLRLMANECILKSQKYSVAKNYLGHAKSLCPDDAKTQISRILLDFMPPLAYAMLRSWRYLRSMFGRVKGRGKRQQAPAPLIPGRYA